MPAGDGFSAEDGVESDRVNPALLRCNGLGWDPRTTDSLCEDDKVGRGALETVEAGLVMRVQQMQRSPRKEITPPPPPRLHRDLFYRIPTAFRTCNKRIPERVKLLQRETLNSL